MTVFQSMAISLRGDAEHGDLAAVAHVGQHVAEGAGVAGHLQADVEAFLHAELLPGRSASDCVADVDGQGRAHLAGQLEAVGIDVGDDDVPGPGVADDARRP